MTLKLKYDVGHGHTAQRALPAPTDDERVFGRAAASLLDEVWSQGMPARLVGVGVSGFDGPRPEQLSLFEGPEGGEASSRDLSALGRVTDAVRDRFGDTAVGYGRDLRFRERVSDTAPMNKSDF